MNVLRNVRVAAAVVALLTTGTMGALAQGGAPAPAQHRPGMLGRMLHRNPPTMRSGPMAHVGNIIGNRNTHVYHLPGTGGNLPAEKNRVYFRTEAEARAAGYHPAGVGGRHVGRMAPRRHPVPMGGGHATRTRDPHTGRYIHHGTGMPAPTGTGGH